MSKSHVDASQLNIRALSSFFGDTTASYKFLFFLSILDIINEEERDGAPISFEGAVTGMLYWAWYPHSQHRLSFGQSDQITRILAEFEKEQSGVSLSEAKETIRSFLQRNPKHIDALMRFVPYRLLTPFVSENLTGLKTKERHRKIEDESAKYSTGNPDKAFPYAVKGEEKLIIPHLLWCKYFKLHYRVLQGWACWNWIRYMQKKNPAVPAIPEKLIPRLKRPAIPSTIKKDWEGFMQKNDLVCIFSKQPVIFGGYELDHFLPWSLVAHNERWNLLPITKTMNQAKSDKIPKLDSFLEPFVDRQLDFLMYLQEGLEGDAFQKKVETYFVDLGLENDSDLLNKKNLLKSYESHMKPLAQIALNQGFEPFCVPK